MSRYTDFCDRKTAEYAGTEHTFNHMELAPQFIEAFNNGPSFRVLVDFGYDKPVWGFVGVTTGWTPVFLLMRRRGQVGSCDALRSEHKIIRSKWIK